MKTTLDLDNDLLAKAKSIAARRRTTLKAIVEHALRREVQPLGQQSELSQELFEAGPFGVLRMKRTPGLSISNEHISSVKRIIDEEEVLNYND